MSRTIVLMYHAIYATDAELAAIDAEDRPYAVSLDRFTAQLDLLGRTCRVVSSLEAATAATSETSVLLTFDDGHASNYQHALPQLRRRGWTGTFFVTSGFVGNRAGFCSWQQLREMSASGMTIGGHGRTHRFLDGLSDADLMQELTASRTEISAGIGKPIDTMSFPGGRYDSRVVRTCASAGYRQLFDSRVNEIDAGSLDSAAPLPRLAIRSTITVEQLAALLAPGSRELQRAARVDKLKQAAKKVLGSRCYHLLYRLAS